jgi:hypothetical protein
VEILDSQVQTDKKSTELVKFSIKATFSDPDAPTPAPAAAVPGGRGRAARGGR